MLQILYSLKSNIESDRYLMLQIHKSKTFKESEEGLSEYNSEAEFRRYAFGVKCFEAESVRDLIWIWDRLKQMCISELNGTYYEDFEEKWDIPDNRYNPKKDNLYVYFKEIIEDKRHVMSMELVDYIHSLDQKELSMSKLLSKIVPEGCMSLKKENGEFEPISNFASEQISLSKAYSVQDFLEFGYVEDIKKISKILKNKGNLGEVITIIDGHNG